MDGVLLRDHDTHTCHTIVKMGVVSLSGAHLLAQGSGLLSVHM